MQRNGKKRELDEEFISSDIDANELYELAEVWLRGDGDFATTGARLAELAQKLKIDDREGFEYLWAMGRDLATAADSNEKLQDLKNIYAKELDATCRLITIDYKPTKRQLCDLAKAFLKGEADALMTASRLHSIMKTIPAIDDEIFNTVWNCADDAGGFYFDEMDRTLRSESFLAEHDERYKICCADWDFAMKVICDNILNGRYLRK